LCVRHIDLHLPWLCCLFLYVYLHCMPLVRRSA